MSQPLRRPKGTKRIVGLSEKDQQAKLEALISVVGEVKARKMLRLSGAIEQALVDNDERSQEEWQALYRG